MSASASPDATQLLTRARGGDAAAAAELLPIVYEELRALAACYLRRERGEHTLQPTALVHEAFVRLVDQVRIEWRDRAHFFRTAAQAMRRVLVDHARARDAAKRGGGCRRVVLDDEVAPQARPQVDLLELDDLLTRLAALNERHAQVIELRFFGGMTIDETAAALGVSTTTVEDDWAVARAWLRRHMRPDAHDSSDHL